MLSSELSNREEVRATYRSWIRSTYSLHFGPRFSGYILAHNSRGNIIMKSAAVGSSPPAKNPPPALLSCISTWQWGNRQLCRWLRTRDVHTYSLWVSSRGEKRRRLTASKTPQRNGLRRRGAFPGTIVQTTLFMRVGVRLPSA